MIRVRVPTPFQVGDVNVYLVGDTLVDTGPKTEEALAVLHQYVDLKTIDTVVITHGHVDHHGLALYVKNLSCCRALVHADDACAVSDYRTKLMDNRERYKEFLQKTGISREFITKFEKFYTLYESYGEPCEVEVLREKVETENGPLRVIHTPGHTPGSCCFLLGDTLYAGDTLLPTISTNPSTQALFDERCGLEPFQRSLKELERLEIGDVFPGHGERIGDHRKRIHEILEEHKERREKIISSLSREFQSLKEITHHVFGSLPSSEVLLALAECYDHLRILEREKIVEVEEGEIYSFRLV